MSIGQTALSSLSRVLIETPGEAGAGSGGASALVLSCLICCWHSSLTIKVTFDRIASKREGLLHNNASEREDFTLIVIPLYERASYDASVR